MDHQLQTTINHQLLGLPAANLQKCLEILMAITILRSMISEPSSRTGRNPKPGKRRLARQRGRTAAGEPLVRSTRISPTEQRHPGSKDLDRMPLGHAIRLMLAEEARIPGILLAQRSRIQKAIEAIVRSFRAGGRLFYVGAGTSGRLGVLDASECPPTFRTPPELIQAIIAGGQPALCGSVEGAEDDQAAGHEAIASRKANRRDVVVGIAASGTTPFVWGALHEAKRRRATTVLISFNPWLKINRRWRPNIIIAPNLGPEVLTGSTRLKAGTATKLILNMFSTLAMVRTGKVISNLMVDVMPANAKLRKRAASIVQDLTGVDAEKAQASLERSNWVIKTAVARLTRKRRPGA